MAVTYPLFYLGPLGAMVPLASPENGLDRSDNLTAVTHTSINGTNTLDIRGYRRTWQLTNSYLYPEDLSYLRQCFTGVVPGPMRLIDPVVKNRCSLSTSGAGTFGSWSGAPQNWKSDNGVATSTITDTPNLTFNSDDGRSLSYQSQRAMDWVASGPGTVYAESFWNITTSTLSAGMSIPVIPNEVVTFSAYMRLLSGSGNIKMNLIPFSAAGVAGSQVGTTSTTSSSWTRHVYTYTVPSSGVASIGLGFLSSLAGHVQIANVQAESGSSATGFVLGNGCPEVLITGLKEASPMHPLVNASLTLLER